MTTPRTQAAAPSDPLSVPCDHCGARRGESCQQWGKPVPMFFHSTRVDKVATPTDLAASVRGSR